VPGAPKTRVVTFLVPIYLGGLKNSPYIFLNIVLVPIVNFGWLGKQQTPHIRLPHIENIRLFCAFGLCKVGEFGF
jgi:hypothetical protein